ncbi:MAG: phage tail protein [Candidatus Dormibacteria bacterium]
MGCIDNSSNCGCHLSGGNCISVTGDGSSGNPYVLAPIVDPSGSNALSCGASGLYVAAAVPSGSIILWPGTAAPTGFLFCLGQAVSRVTYAALNTLASAVSYAAPWGSGDGVTTFNVPNLQGLFPVGVSGSDATFTLGATGGEKTHTLTTAEIPAHAHDVGLNLNAQNQAAAAGAYIVSGTGDWNTQNTGGGGAHQNLPPFRAFNFAIKT